LKNRPQAASTVVFAVFNCDTKHTDVMNSYPMYVDVEWCSGGQLREMIPPALGESFVAVAWLNRQDAHRAIAAAASGFSRWSQIPLWEQAALCEGMAAGGRPPARPGYFIKPTVLVDFTLDSPINREETFVRIALIAPFRDGGEALHMAGSCRPGLAAGGLRSNSCPTSKPSRSTWETRDD
jgi:acyl-CoA reductase-like NAD-dependent aldehyde dehydrogenase